MTASTSGKTRRVGEGAGGRGRDGFLGIILKDSGLAGLGAGLARMHAFAVNLIASRMLHDQMEYGAFASVYLVAQMVATFASLGLAQTAARAIAAEEGRPREQDRVARSVMVLIVGTAAASAAILALGAPAWGRLMQGRVSPRTFRWGAFIVFGQLAVAGAEGVLRGYKHFRWLPIAAASASVIGLAATVPLVRWAGITGAVGALALFLVVQGAATLIPLKRALHGSLLSLSAMKRLLTGTAAPSFISGLSWNAAMIVPPLMLVRSRFGLEHMALWNVASQLRVLVGFAPVVIVNAALPHLAAMHSEGTLNVRKAAVMVAASMSVSILPYFGVLAFAPHLMGMYGDTYRGHAQLLNLVSTVVLIQVLGVGLFGVLLATGNVWYASVINAVWCCVTLAAAPACIDRAGAYGLANLYLWTYVPVLLALAAIAVATFKSLASKEAPARQHTDASAHTRWIRSSV